jgi:hypothetical protein
MRIQMEGQIVAEIRFSRRTIIAAIEVMEGKIQTHAALTRCYLKWAPDVAARCSGGTLEDRFNHLIRCFDEEPERPIDGGHTLRDAIVEKAVALFPGFYDDPDCGPVRLTPQEESFLRALALDGFTIKDGELRRTLPAGLHLVEAENEVSHLLDKHRFAVAKGHLDLAFSNHTDGQWSPANGQVRNFLDSLLDEIAERIDPAIAGLPSGQPRRIKLAEYGFLSRPLNEWDGNGLGFMNGLVKRLHPQGPHPGLSDPDDSTFRLHIVLLTARLLLVRFDKRGVT